jgi:hypothetical protein
MAQSLTSKVRRKLGKTLPFRRVHVNVLFISDNLLIKLIDMHLLLSVGSPQQIQEILDKLPAEILNVSLRILADKQNLSDVIFALDVTFETVLIAHLSLASLAVPSQTT